MTKLSAVSLTVTSKGQVTLRKELLAHLGIQPGQRVDVEVLLAGRSARRASLAELNEAAASGWAGLPTSLPATN